MRRTLILGVLLGAQSASGVQVSSDDGEVPLNPHFIQQQHRLVAGEDPMNAEVDEETAADNSIEEGDEAADDDVQDYDTRGGKFMYAGEEP